MKDLNVITKNAEKEKENWTKICLLKKYFQNLYSNTVRSQVKKTQGLV